MFTPASRGKQSSSLLHGLPIPAVNVAPLAAFIWANRCLILQRLLHRGSTFFTEDTGSFWFYVQEQSEKYSMALRSLCGLRS